MRAVYTCGHEELGCMPGQSLPQTCIKCKRSGEADPGTLSHFKPVRNDAMTNDHTPDQELMDRVCSILNRGPMTVAGITIALPSEPKVSPQQVRQALHDLMHYGKVVLMTDGKQYRLSDKPVINGKGVA